MILIGDVPIGNVKDLDVIRAVIMLEMIELSDLKAKLRSFSESSGMEVNS